MSRDRAAAAWERGPWGEGAPIAHHLVAQFSEHWFRLHFFADERRYPTTSAEEAEVERLLERLIADLIGGDGDVWLFDWTLSEEDGDGEQEEIWFGRDYSPFAAAPSHRAATINLFPFMETVFNLKWSTLLFGEMTGNAIAVYDGGVDCFVHSKLEREKAMSLFEPNLSTHPAGL